ncbi:MAG: hypothetical protein ACRDH2_18175 [Anaerolineales bacterium]
MLSSGVGVCVALQQFVIAVGATGLTLVVLRGLQFIEQWMGSKKSS